MHAPTCAFRQEHHWWCLGGADLFPRLVNIGSTHSFSELKAHRNQGESVTKPVVKFPGASCSFVGKKELLFYLRGVAQTINHLLIIMPTLFKTAKRKAQRDPKTQEHSDGTTLIRPCAAPTRNSSHDPVLLSTCSANPTHEIQMVA